MKQWPLVPTLIPKPRHCNAVSSAVRESAEVGREEDSLGDA
jgi:hypothetical protein